MLKLRRLWLFTRVLYRAGWIDCVITDDELAMLNYLRVLLPKCVNKASHWLLWARWSWSKPGWIFFNLSTLNLLWNWVCSSRFVPHATVHFKLRKTEQTRPEHNFVPSLCFHSVTKWANLRQTSYLAEYKINACTQQTSIFTVQRWKYYILLFENDVRWISSQTSQQGNSLKYSKG